MIRIAFIGMLLFAQTIVLAQTSPVELWRSAEYVENINVEGPIIALDKYQNTYMLTTQLDDTPLVGYTLVKYDSLGHALWNQSYPVPSIFGFIYGSFTVDSLGFSYVSLIFNGGWAGDGANAILVKYSPDGEQLWDANYGLNQTGDNYIFYTDLAPSGRLIALGMNLSNTVVADNFLFVSAIDPATGAELWKTKVPGSFGPQNLRVHADRIQILATQYLPGDNDYVIMQLDFNGNILEQYAKPYTGYAIDFNYITQNGDVLLGNRAFGYNAAKLSAEGDTLWTYNFPDVSGSINNWVRAVVEDDSMYAYLTGAAHLPGYNYDADFITTKLSPAGTVIWEKAYRLKEENTPDTGNSLFVGEQYVFAVGGGKDSTGKTLGMINVYDKVKGDEIYTILIEQDYSVSVEKCIVVNDKIYYTATSHNNTPTSTNILTGAFLLPKITSSSHVFLDSNLKVFPNPTVDQLNIDNIDPSVFNYLEVASISGQVMMRSAIKENTVTVDMSAYPAGVYLISMQGKGVVINKKIIKTD